MDRICVLVVRLPKKMRRLVLIHEQERFVLVPLMLQPLASLIDNDIAIPSFKLAYRFSIKE